MEEIFEFEGQEYTLAEVQAAATAKSLNIDDYINQYNISRKTGKTTPPQEEQGATAEVITAPKLDLPSADSLLEYPGAKLDYINALTDPAADKYKIIKNRYFINTADPIKGAETIAQEEANKKYLESLPKKFDKGYFTKEEKEAYEKYKETGNIDSSLLKDAYIRPINPETLKPYTGLEMAENILEDFWPGAKAQLKGLQSMGIEFISKVAGTDASDFLLGEMDLDTKIVKKDNKYFYEKNGIIQNQIGEETKKTQKKLYDDYIALQESMQYKGSISEGIKSGDLTTAIAGIGNAFSGAVQTMVPALLTRGYSLYPQIAGTMFMDFNIAKANALYKNDPNAFDKLIDNNELDFNIPASLALLSSVSEKIGLNKITEAIKANPFVGQFLVKTLWAGGTEAGTGYAQFLIEETNNNLGKQMPILKAIEETGKVAFSPEALEATLQEAFGGIGISIAGKGIKAVAGIRADVYPDIEDDINKLSDLKQKYTNAKDDIVAEGIQNQIIELEEKIKNSMVRANGIFLNSSEKELSDINNLVDLKQKQIERTKKLIEARDKGEISEQDYLDALEGYKQSFIAAKNKISGITQNISENANKSAQNVEKIYQEKGKDGIAEIVELYRPMAEKLAMKRRNVPGFDKELLTDEILTGKRGILDLINEYNPTENPGITLPMYVNKFAATRAIEASKRILKTEFETDVTEAKGVTDTVIADTNIEIREQAKQDIKTELAKDLNLSEETQNEIVAAVEKTLGTKLPPVTDKKFRQALTTGFRNELTNTFKSIFGKTAAYEQFLRDNFEKIYPAIPQETINRNFKEFNEPVLDPKTGKQLRERTAEGKKVFKKRDISKAEFIKYFLDAPGNVKGARKTSLAKVLADEIGLDNVLTSLSKPEVVEKFKAIQELQGQEVPSNFIEIISEKIDRAIDYLDGLQKNNDTLYVSLVVPELAIAVAKTFLKAFKLAFKATGNFAKAFKKAIEEAKKLLPNKEEQQALENAAKNTFKKAEDIADIPTNEKFVKNLDTAISEVRAKKIVDNKIAELQKTKNVEDVLNFMRYIGDPLKNGGFVVGNNSKELFEFIKNQNVLSKEDLKRFKVTGKVNFRIYFDGKLIKQLVKNSNPKTMTGKNGNFAKNPAKFTEYIKENLDDFDNQADYNKTIVLGEITKLTFKGRKEDAKNLLQLWGSNTASDTPLRMMGKLRSYQVGVKEVTYEHTPPIATLREQLEKLIDNYKEGDSALDFTNAVKKVLDKSFVDLVQSRQKGKDVIPKTGNTVERYSSILDVNKDLIYFRNDPNKKSLNRQFNENILQKSTGVKWTETFSPVKAKLMGKGKGKKFFIPYSADDFVGLLYTTLASGKAGDAQMKWYEENLLRPFSRGIQQYEAAKQQALREWVAIKKEAKKNVPGGLNKVNDTGFRNQDAVRLYIWNKQGNDIPGLLKKDLNPNLKIIKENPKLKEFADRLIALQPEGYPPPSENWLVGDITTDLVGYINGVKRSEFLTEWKDNVDIIFSEKNMDKLRGLYGDLYVEALDNMLHRMRTGTNRYKGADRTTKRFMDWTNNSVGTIMFFNARSAVLQTLSAVNFINFSDNNPINAGLAFANQKQFWSDFSELWSSDFLKQRRSGLQTDVNADEIARAAATAENKAQAVLSYLLKIGFAPTQAADSFAIAMGGASFYRNRIKKYIKEGLSETEAQKKAFTDFQEIAEETQQSARPDRISMQQASPLGRLILAFGNTPMQYARLTKKAALDLINGRGDWKTNISKIAYYSVIQNIIFSALQQGLFALLFSDEEDDKEKERYFKLGNGMADTLLRGIGVYGAAAATVKNMIFEIIKQEKSKRPNYTEVAIQSTSISPPINSKLRKLISAGKTFTYKQSREKVFTEGFSLENPAFLATGQVLSAGINLPADRMVLKLDHLKTAMEPETELWQSIALGLGWSEWDLGMIEKETKKESNLKIKPFKTKDLKIKPFKQ